MQRGRPAYPHWGSSHPPTGAQTPTRNQKRPQNDKEDATDSLHQLIAFLLEIYQVTVNYKQPTKGPMVTKGVPSTRHFETPSICFRDLRFRAHWKHRRFSPDAWHHLVAEEGIDQKEAKHDNCLCLDSQLHESSKLILDPRSGHVSGLFSHKSVALILPKGHLGARRGET